MTHIGLKPGDDFGTQPAQHLRRVEHPLLGNVEIGQYARIGAGSVVLNDVPPHVSVAGVPAKVVGKVEGDPSAQMDHSI